MMPHLDGYSVMQQIGPRIPEGDYLPDPGADRRDERGSQAEGSDHGRQGLLEQAARHQK